MLFQNLQILSIRLNRLLIGILIVAASSPANGQTITVGASPPAASSKAFNSTAVSDIKTGTYPAQFMLGNG